MTRYTLINCDFLVQSTFLKLSNKSKLLYYAFLTNADSLGIVGNCDEIIQSLVRCDDDYENAKMLGTIDALNDDYITAKIELMNKCYTYLFNDKLGNEIFVVKHWFLHNKYRPNLTTNYKKIFKQLEIIDGEYYLKTHKKGETSKEEESKGKATEREEENKEIINKESVNNDLSKDNSNSTVETPKEEIFDEEWNELLKELDEPLNNKESEENE